MPPKLSQYLNRSILVSIPALYDDGKCRAYTLRGADSNGVWLYSQELVKRLLLVHDESVAATDPAIFVPYAQIAALILAAPSPAVPSAETDNTAAGARNTSATAASTTPKPPAPTSPKAASPAESSTPKTPTSS